MKNSTLTPQNQQACSEGRADKTASNGLSNITKRLELRKIIKDQMPDYLTQWGNSKSVHWRIACFTCPR